MFTKAATLPYEGLAAPSRRRRPGTSMSLDGVSMVVEPEDSAPHAVTSNEPTSPQMEVPRLEQPAAVVPVVVAANAPKQSGPTPATLGPSSAPPVEPVEHTGPTPSKPGLWARLRGRLKGESVK